MVKKRFRPNFTITNRITAGLTRIERARGFLEAAALSDAWVREMGRRALILEAHHTTHIEGTRLTLEQAERLLDGNPVPEADPDTEPSTASSGCLRSANTTTATGRHSIGLSRESASTAWT